MRPVDFPWRCATVGLGFCRWRRRRCWRCRRREFRSALRRSCELALILRHCHAPATARNGQSSILVQVQFHFSLLIFLAKFRFRLPCNPKLKESEDPATGRRPVFTSG